MKKIIIVVILCVAGWAGATFVFGNKAESRYYELLEQYGRLGGTTITSQSYERGFLNSTAKTVLEITVPQTAPDAAVEPVQLVFEHTMQHGPLPLGDNGALSPALVLVESKLVSVSPNGAMYEKLLAEVPELQDTVILARIGLDGALTSQVQVPPFEATVDEAQIHWGGLELESEYDPGKQTSSGTLDMPKMEIRAEGAKIIWNGIHGRIDLTEALPMLYVGDTEVVFGGLDMSFPDEKSGGQKKIKAEGLEILASTGCEEQMFNYLQTMKLATVSIDGDTYGPGVLDIELSNLDGMALSDFQGQLQEMSRDPNIPPEELAARLPNLYSQLLLKLLAGNPKIKISRLHFATPQGDIDGSLELELAGQPGAGLANPITALQQLKANADIAIHENLLITMVASNLKPKLKAAQEAGEAPPASDEEIGAQAEAMANQQLEAMLAQNFIVREGEKIKANATMANGELVLNGQPLPFFQGQ